MNLNPRLVASFLLLASSTAAFPTKKNRLSASSSSVVSGRSLQLSVNGCDVGEQHQKILDDLQNRYDNNCKSSYEDSLNLEWKCEKTYGNGVVDTHVYTAGRSGPDATIEPLQITYKSGALQLAEFGPDLCTAYADYQEFVGDSSGDSGDEPNPDCDLNVIHDNVITLLDLAIGNCNIVGKGDYTHYICESEVGYADYEALNADGPNPAIPYDIHIGETKSSTEFPTDFIHDNQCAAPAIVWGAIQKYLLPDVLDELKPDPTVPGIDMPPAGGWETAGGWESWYSYDYDWNSWYNYDYEAAITQFNSMGGETWLADYKSDVEDFYSGWFSKNNNDEASAVEDADVVVTPPAADETDHGDHDHADSADHVTDAADAAATATDAVNNEVKVTVSSASLLSSSMMGIAAVTTAFVAMA